ncbi:hypothetical protein [Streptomyces sp. MZ04]|uniref:hypothetical protein n=1 Tax=Streptomyces sp. MZ04 TaxID=2559236 RepID=UPI00107EE3FA|nr:hypothetical protein [Streptomyces sp. MZ04]TGB16094.1 hypothetical protein E2651_01280 [Streptomyces sp. MZ04]
MKYMKIISGGIAAASLLSLGAAEAGAVGQNGGQVEAKAATGKYKILKSLDYRRAGNMPLRQGYYSGGKGFGWTKVKKKHNITKYAAVEYIAKSPKYKATDKITKKHPKHTSFTFWGYSQKIKCTNGRCRVVKEYQVKLAVQEDIRHSGRDRKPKGVITMYCQGVTRCPGWVSIGLAKANKRSARMPRSGDVVTGSYKPVLKRTFAVTAKAADAYKYGGSYKPLMTAAAREASYAPAA